MVTEHVSTQSELLYRIPEAARRIGVSRTKMYELINQGAIRTVKFAGVRRVPADDLVDFVRQLREESGSDAATK